MLEKCAPASAGAFFIRQYLGRIYDGAQRNVIDQFLSCIPEVRTDLISPSQLDSNVHSVNASIGIKALTAKRIHNGLELENRQNVERELISQLAGNDLPALLFDSEQAREFRAHFADSNRKFTERFIGRPLEDLGGRRLSDLERDRICEKIREQSKEIQTSGRAQEIRSS